VTAQDARPFAALGWLRRLCTDGPFLVETGVFKSTEKRFHTLEGALEYVEMLRRHNRTNGLSVRGLDEWSRDELEREGWSQHAH
jgi:hypothetical protein